MRMTTPSPEVSKNPENPGTNYELKTLKSSVSADYKKFETLSKDASLKKWLEKIMKKGLSWRIESFAKNYNSLSKERVGYYTARMVKYHPELISFIAWELWLPIKTDKSRVEYDFSALSLEQKLSFMALYEAEYDLWSNFKNVGTKQIIDKYKSYLKQFSEEATNKLNKEVDKKKVLWFVDLEKVLKKEYWLTDTEYKKMKEYIELIQKHPEYVWWEFKNMVNVAAFDAGLWVLIALLIGIVIWAVVPRKKLFGIKPEVKTYWEWWEISNFKDVFQVITQESDFKEHWWMEVNMYQIDWDDNFLLEWGKHLVNYFESKKIHLEVKWKLAVVFNAEKAKCDVEMKKWKWILHVKVGKPQIMIKHSEAKVDYSDREWINLSEFDNTELEQEKRLKLEAIQRAENDPNFKKAAELQLKEQLLKIFRTTWIATSEMVIKGEDIQDVIIEYTD